MPEVAISYWYDRESDCWKVGGDGLIGRGPTPQKAIERYAEAAHDVVHGGEGDGC